MESWTFFCKNGSYGADYRAEHTRWVCHGIGYTSTEGIDGAGQSRSRLKMWIPLRQAWLEGEDGERIPVDMRSLRPGDLVTAGICADADGPFWQITGVKRMGSAFPQSLFAGGFIVTAE